MGDYQTKSSVQQSVARQDVLSHLEENLIGLLEHKNGGTDGAGFDAQRALDDLGDRQGIGHGPVVYFFPD